MQTSVLSDVMTYHRFGFFMDFNHQLLMRNIENEPVYGVGVLSQFK